jgi:diadenylate cyclase
MEVVKGIYNVFLNIIQTISIWDILDIAIVAYLLYRLLLFVRKTSAGGVVKGIFLLIAVLWLSSLLNLNVINFLLGKTMELGILALIVLFQPEIRKFLEQFGRKNITGFFRRQIKTQVIDDTIAQTVQACLSLSKTKTGALIVFEREIRLDDYVKTGTLINAEPSAELLKNIFYPKAPLHDGAVIVREGRIMGAGCMLPLTNNTNLSRDLGMRHRAGIGMSERSDAVVVIVSEETGAISVAVDGMLKRRLDRETFERLLKNELMDESNVSRSKKGSILSRVKNNGKRND